MGIFLLKVFTFRFQLPCDEHPTENQVFRFYMYSKNYVKTLFAIYVWHPRDHLHIKYSDVLLTFGVLLTTDNPLVPGIAHMYLADRAKHDELAAEWTLRFAK